MDSKASPYNLDGKVALVTGAARGIGRACALALAEAGADIVLGLRDKKNGAPLAVEIEKMGRNVLPVQMDISQMAEIKSAVKEAKQHFNHIDILINNAGIGTQDNVENVKESEFDYILSVNLKGTFFVSQEVGRIMIKQKEGWIVNLSSQAGFIALPTESVYCMTKAGIAHLTKCMALEWAKHNIRVNAVAPTFIKTPGTDKWLGDPEFKKSVLRRIPLGRIGEPIDVARSVVFLSSHAAEMITGETLMIDGGWTIQ